jgi:hypothetical protein
MQPPQPASEPYSSGDSVTVYVADDDVDAEYHGTECTVVNRFTDDLNTETDRETDQYTYRLEAKATGDVLPVDFRHADLVPPQQVNE